MAQTKSNRFKSLWNNEPLYLFVVLFLKLLTFISIQTTVEQDTASYASINGFSLENWLNEVRTPVYPFLIEVCERLAGPHGFQIMAAIQFIVACAAIVCLHDLLKRLDIHPSIRKLATLFYAVSVPTNVWDSILLTESLSLSLTVFYCWLMFRYLSKPSIRYIGICAALLFVMVFLRPTFAAFLVLTIVFLIVHLIVNKKIWKTALASIGILLVLLSTVMAYTEIYNQKYGNRSLSNTLLVQQLAVLIRGDLYHTGGNPAIMERIDILVEEAREDNSYDIPDKLSELSIAHQIKNDFGNEATSTFINTSICTQFPQLLYNRAFTFLREFSTPFGRMPAFNFTAWALPGLLINGLSYLLLPLLSIGIGFHVALACAGYSLWKLFRKRTWDFFMLGVSGYILLIYAFSFWGTCGDYARTAIAAVPFILIGFTILISRAYDYWVCRQNR